MRVWSFTANVESPGGSPFYWACAISSLRALDDLERFLAKLDKVVPCNDGYIVHVLVPFRARVDAATGFWPRHCRDGAWRVMLRAFVEIAPAGWPARGRDPQRIFDSLASS